MQHTFITNDFEETRQLGRNIAKNLNGGDIIALYGDIGSGKTTFMQGVAKELGITHKIISPTFVITRIYKIPSHSKKNIHNKEKRLPKAPDKLYHIDLYRLADRKSIQTIGISEILEDQKAIVAVEWAEKANSFFLKKCTISITFEQLENEKRKITIK